MCSASVVGILVLRDRSSVRLLILSCSYEVRQVESSS